jgi:hypothetical protein
MPEVPTSDRAANPSVPKRDESQLCIIDNLHRHSSTSGFDALGGAAPQDTRAAYEANTLETLFVLGSLKVFFNCAGFCPFLPAVTRAAVATQSRHGTQSA